MKKTLLIVVTLLAAIISASAQKIKGSDTVLPVSQKEAEN